MTTSLRPACVDALRLLGAGAPADEGAPHAGSAELRAARRRVAACPSCAAVVDDVGSPDAVLAALDEHRPARRPRLRTVLGLLSALQCALALPWLFDLNPLAFLAQDVASEHLTRDGAIGVIVGVAGLTTAVRTRHALAMLVTGSAAIGMQVLTFAIDENHDRVHPLFELSHALVPIILALIAVFTVRRATPIRPPTRDRNLRAVR
jgi:hypothetical protein